MANSRPRLTPIRTQSRTASFKARPAGLERIQSSRYFDDHFEYHEFHHDRDDEDESIDAQTGDPGFAGDADVRGDSDEGTLVDPHDEVEPREKREEYEDPRAGREEAEDDETEVAEIRAGVPNLRDVESRPGLEKTKSRRSQRKDPNLVSWEGPEDPENPKNWRMKRKWAATFVVSSFTFISPVSSSMVAPALGVMSADLHITSSSESALILSIFILAYAVGPLFLGPLSETFGRVKVLQYSNLFYLVWNLCCGFARNKGEMLAFRFLSGLGGSAPLAIGGGVLSDVWTPEQRGKAISIYSLAPLLGPAVGPIAGGFITENTTWRWVFWATTIADAAIQISGYFYLQETYAPKLLARKAARLRKETGNDALHTEWEHPDRTLGKVLRTALVRPFRLLFTQPIIISIAIYMAVLYGDLYLLLSTFPSLWTSPQYYNESIGIGGLNYISLGLGFFLGTQITAPINDRIYRRLKKRNNNVGRPEFRVPLMFIGSVLIPIGFFWYGWSAEVRLHWIMPNIGAAIFGAGSIICFQCMQTYIVDSYSRYAASGVAAAVVLRSMAGFGFPLFADAMYGALGYGWGNSVLGFVAIVVGIPAPFLFWFYGQKLRGMSKFAAG